MPKNGLFCSKSPNRQAPGAKSPDPLASGGWSLRLQTPVQIK